MVVVSNHLNTGEITFILRVLIQILSYGGVLLIGLIVFGSVPKVAALETHDLLNRVVGQSTATMGSLTWIVKRTFRRTRDPISSSALAFSLALSLFYGLLVSLSDVGLIGLHSCTVPGSSFRDFPASIRSDSDALAVISSNMLNASDIHTIRSYRCDFGVEGQITEDDSGTICASWHNSTYSDPSNFGSLNSTDSDVLMVRSLANLKGNPEINTWIFGTSGQSVLEPTIVRGLAVIPHETGVSVVVGVPDLFKEQKVDIPKTLALEVEIGCLPLGITGERLLDPRLAQFAYHNFSGASADFFTPDEIYHSTRIEQYVGPDILREALMQIADFTRNQSVAAFNSSIDTVNGNLIGRNISAPGSFTMQSMVSTWAPPYIFHPGPTDPALVQKYCTSSIDYRLLNITVYNPYYAARFLPCSYIQLSGTYTRDGSAIQGYAAMVCAATTQVNMVAATLLTDGAGALSSGSSSIVPLPSDLNINMVYKGFQFSSNIPPIEGVPTTSAPAGTNASFISDNTIRFTLSDNPAGNLTHHIYQIPINFAAPIPFAVSDLGLNIVGMGLASPGQIFPTAGYAALVYFDSGAFGPPNSSYFSANFSTSLLSSWAGGIAASYLIQSLGYNGWVARGSQGFTVVSTGGHSAACYDLRFGAAFLPLLVAAFVVASWVVVIFFTSGIRNAGRLQTIYSGLSPTIGPQEKHPLHTALAWDNEFDPYLKPATEQMTTEERDAESEGLVPNEEGDKTHSRSRSGSTELIPLNTLKKVAK